MLPAQYRLRRTADVGRARQEGRRWQHPLIALFVYKQPQEIASTSRFAFAVGRHIGKATRRNLVKRRLRSAVSRHLNELEPGYDCLFVARRGAVTASFDELERAAVQLLSRGGVMTDDRKSPELEESSS